MTAYGHSEVESDDATLSHLVPFGHHVAFEQSDAVLWDGSWKHGHNGRHLRSSASRTNPRLAMSTHGPAYISRRLEVWDPISSCILSKVLCAAMIAVGCSKTRTIIVRVAVMMRHRRTHTE